MTWLNTVQRDLRSYNLTVNEAVDLAQNRPLWKLMFNTVYRYSVFLVVHVRKEEEEPSLSLLCFRFGFWILFPLWCVIVSVLCKHTREFYNCRHNYRIFMVSYMIVLPVDFTIHSLFASGQ